MSSTQSMMDYVLDQLSALPGVRSRRMFGEYAIYLGEKMPALLCDDQVFLKPTDIGRAMLGTSVVEAPPHPQAKPYLVLGADEIEDSERFCALILATAEAMPLPVPKKPKKPKTAKTPKVAKVAKRKA